MAEQLSIEGLKGEVRDKIDYRSLGSGAIAPEVWSPGYEDAPFAPEPSCVITEAYPRGAWTEVPLEERKILIERFEAEPESI